MTAAHPLWLGYGVLVVLALLVAALAVGRHVRRRHPAGRTRATTAPNDRAASSVSDVGGAVLPDFAVVDCGDQIHFVPLHEKGHVVGARPCPCLPRRTANRRRAGGRVTYPITTAWAGALPPADHEDAA
jgi:hypothetical protein